MKSRESVVRRGGRQEAHHKSSRIFFGVQDAAARARADFNECDVDNPIGCLRLVVLVFSEIGLFDCLG